MYSTPINCINISQFVSSLPSFESHVPRCRSIFLSSHSLLKLPHSADVHNGVRLSQKFRHQKITNLWSLFQNTVENFPNFSYLGWKEENEKGPSSSSSSPEYQWLNYAACKNLIDRIAHRIIELKLSNNDDHGNKVQTSSSKIQPAIEENKNLNFTRVAQPTIGIMMKNSPEWMLIALSCLSIGYIVVPIDPLSSLETVQKIIIAAKCKILFIHYSNCDLLYNLLSQQNDHKDNSTFLKHVILCHARNINENKSSENKKHEEILKFTNNSLNFHKFDEFTAETENKSNLNESLNLLAPINVNPTSAAFIIFSSGTTGDAKGVILTHGNFLSTVAAGPPHLTINTNISELLKLNPLKNNNTISNEVYENITFNMENNKYVKTLFVPGLLFYSYLPLVHIFDLLYNVFCFASGGKVIFATNGNPKNFIEDLKIIKPNVFISVPRILNKLYHYCKGYMNALEIKENQINRFESELLMQKYNYDNNLPLTFFPTLEKALKLIGLENCSLSVCGSAPLNNDIFQFYRLIGLPLCIGYGLTETTCGISFQDPWDRTIGSAGPPSANNEVKLVSVEELGYSINFHPPRGEIWARGPNIFSGYINANSPLVSADSDNNPWFKTGDIGQWNSNGTLSIIDRISNIFKNSLGVFVAPEKIETEYLKSNFITQIFITGDSFHSQLIAIVAPHAENIIKEMIKQQIISKEEIQHFKNVNTNGAENDKNGEISMQSSSFRHNFRRVFSEENPQFCTLKSKIVSFLTMELSNQVAKSNLFSYERIHKFYFESCLDELSMGFTEKNGMISNTNKLKRKVIKNVYKNIIEKLLGPNE